jgi:hypothetical protein
MSEKEHTSSTSSSGSTQGPAATDSPGVSRRGFLGVTGMAAAVMAAGGLALEPLVKGGATAAAQEIADAATTDPFITRRDVCWKYRTAMADFNRGQALSPHTDNGDEARYPSKIGNYSKGLPHNRFGEVDQGAYNSYKNAINSGKPADFENIIMGSTNPIGKLTNPQSGLAFDLEGGDSHFFVEPAAPALASAEEAGEGVELYWMSLLRDVNFNDYADSELAASAAAELSKLSDFRGLKDSSGKVTRATLFRDPFPGCDVGPYVSQFMILPTPFGVEWISRQGRVSLPGDDHMTSFSAWLNVENGNGKDGAIKWDPVRRYMRNARDLASWVHVDVLFQAYFNACLIMLTPPDPSDDVTGGGLGVPLNPGNPYKNSKTQIAFGTFGPPAIKALMCEVASRALKAQWFQKWYVHRRLRPEALGGLVHVQKAKNRYPGVLGNELLNSEAVARTYAKNGTWLLPMCFPEGSPTHPAYGSGHATVAGASITILKALFDESFVIPNPKVASADGLALEPWDNFPPLTVGGELNKLASNIATGRNHAGVHWRTDAVNAMRLGEAVAISVLRDQRAAYNEVFSGYTFTKLDGTKVTV